MELEVSLNLSTNLNNTKEVEKFIGELTKFLEQSEVKSVLEVSETSERLKSYRKEGHLYLVEEDVNDKIYLWDLTDKPSYSFEEVDFPKELLDKAKEGAVFQYIDGKYQYYSDDGFDRI